METLLKLMIWGVPLFSETPVSSSTKIEVFSFGETDLFGVFASSRFRRMQYLVAGCGGNDGWMRNSFKGSLKDPGKKMGEK